MKTRSELRAIFTWMPALLLLLLSACDKPSPAAADQSSPGAPPPQASAKTAYQAGAQAAGKPAAAAPASAAAPQPPPKPPYPQSDATPPRPKRKLSKELEDFQAAWDKAIAAADADAFLKLRADYADEHGYAKNNLHVSNWDSMAEGGAGEFMVMSNPYDVCVEHGLAPWMVYASDAKKPVAVVPGGLLRLKMEDAFEAPKSAASNNTDNKYSIGTPQLGDWPGFAGGSSSGWFMGTDTKTGEKKPYNIVAVTAWFTIPDKDQPGSQKIVARLLWKKPTENGLQDAEITKDLTLDFVPVPRPDAETLLCLLSFGTRLGEGLAKADKEDRAKSGGGKADAEDKPRVGLMHLAWADRLMKGFTKHQDPQVSAMAAKLAAHPDWVAKVSKGYDPEMVSKMENLARAAAELRSKLAKPLPDKESKKEPEPPPADSKPPSEKKAAAPADTRPQAHGLVAEMADAPADMPVNAGLDK